MPPYTTYIDTQGGGHVSAIQAQHPGKLADSLEWFDDGDYIVIFPETFEGVSPRKVFLKASFSQRFRLKNEVIKPKRPLTWSELARG